MKFNYSVLKANVNQVYCYGCTAEYARFLGRYERNSSKFDVNIHSEKYHKADVLWNYSSFLQQSDKWQVVETCF